MDYRFEESLDDLDVAILNELQRDGRITNAELARRINLSPSATHARLSQLEAQGYIRQYTALLNRECLGYDMLCLVLISIEDHRADAVEVFQSRVKQIPRILECHHTTGAVDYILKVVIRDREDLERFLVKELSAIPHIARLQTMLVIREVKSTTTLPMD